MRRIFLLGTIVMTGLCAVILAAPPKTGAAVSIHGLKFDPSTVQIKAGEAVTWTNNDDRDHTIDAADDSFHSGNLKPGATFSHTFAKVGEFAYACSYHPRMKGAVVVK